MLEAERLMAYDEPPFGGHIHQIGESFMPAASLGNDTRPGSGNRRPLTILIWLALGTGWLVSTFSVIQEMCMVSACRDTASFTIFGLNMGWFGIGYFSLVLVVLWLRRRDSRFDRVLSALVFCGIGAEFRLLWIQKFIIGGWCPLCVTICCALFAAAILLVIEKGRGTGADGVEKPFVWMSLAVVMSGIGLAVAMLGVKALY
jgi:hypothetical protein